MAAKGYHHGDLRSALISKALNALARDGQLPSWRALARACAVSQSAPYRHFASLDELRVAVIAEGFRRLESSIRAALAIHTDPFARLAAGCRAYIKYGVDNVALYGLMFSDPGALAAGEAADASASAYRTLIEGVSGTGVRDVLGVAFALWTGHHGTVDIVRVGIRPPGAPATLDAMIEREIDMLIGYVKSVLAAEGSRAKKR
jgi:AcrR family transcriptional regulator